MRSSDLKATSRARLLRREATGAENKLWAALRGRQAGGCKFVRQEPIGPYFADFVCRARKLIIEIDGAIHDLTNEMASDERRTSYLSRLGYRVIRFTNADIYESLDHVIEKIGNELAFSASHGEGK